MSLSQRLTLAKPRTWNASPSLTQLDSVGYGTFVRSLAKQCWPGSTERTRVLRSRGQAPVDRRSWQPWLMKPLLQYVDAVTVPVPDLDRGMAFYSGVLGHELIWRDEATGQAGLRTPESSTEIVLTTRQRYEPDWKVASASAAA